MSRVLVAGLCPLPYENTRQSYGPGIRTWQFAESLAASGHEVHLVAMAIPGVYDLPVANEWTREHGVSLLRMEQATFMDPVIFESIVASVDPELVVGATVYGSYPLARLRLSVPFWADQFGHYMAEAQAKAALDGNDDILDGFWTLASTVSREADRISTVSTPQKWSQVGELGALGRLNHHTCGEELVEVIPCAVIPHQLAAPEEAIARGRSIPTEAFIVLWSGGYNVWSDVKTLFHGIEDAMASNSRVHFLSTGGAIEGHDTKTYSQFQESVSASKYADRFHLEGWVDAELIPLYTAEADVGVLTELPMYEGRLGSKNRILQWMGNGLPVLYNQVGELGQLLQQEQLGLVFEQGAPKQLSEKILWAASHSEDLNDMAERALDVSKSRFTFEATTRPLVSWANAPKFASDRHQRAQLASADAEGHDGGVEQEAEARLGPESQSADAGLWRRLLNSFSS